MARGGGKKKGKKNKSGISIEKEQKYISMKPSDLAAELAIEENALEIEKNSNKEDEASLAEQVKEFEEALKNTKAVNDALENLNKVKAENMDPDHIKAKEDLAAKKKGNAGILKERKAEIKFMKKTLKYHIESGALKRPTK